MDKELEVAWAAGLFEGEGSIPLVRRNKNTRMLSIKMTDKDVMEKFVDVVGFGNLTGPLMYEKCGHKKPYWSWQLQKKPEVLRILKMFLPYFGKRRAGKAIEAINHLNEIIN